MKNKKRLQSKVHHVALATIVIAGLIAPAVQLAPVFPGMSLQDVKAATTGTLDTVKKTGVTNSTVSGVAAKTIGDPIATAVDGKATWIPGVGGNTTNQMYAGDPDNYGVVKGSPLTRMTYVENSSPVQMWNTYQYDPYDASASGPITPNLHVNTTSGQTAFYQSYSTPYTADYQTFALKVTLPAGMRFTGVQQLAYYAGSANDPLNRYRNIISDSAKSKLNNLTVKLFDDNGNQITRNDIKIGNYSGHVVYNTNSGGETATKYDSDVKDEVWANVKSIEVYGPMALSKGDQPVLMGSVTMPKNGLMTTPGTYTIQGQSGIGYDRPTAEKFPATANATFNIMQPVDNGAITNSATYTDATGNAVTSGAYTGNVAVVNDKLSDSRSLNSTGTYTISTGSNTVHFAKAPEYVNNAGADVSGTFKTLPTITYYTDLAKTTTTTDPTKAVVAVLSNFTNTAGTSINVKSTLVGSVSEKVTTKRSFNIDADTSQWLSASVLNFDDFVWNAIPATVSGNITYVDAAGKAVATGKYADKQPGASTADITAPTTTDGYRYKVVSVDKSTYDGSDIKVTVAKIATGNINYVYNGKTVSSTPFTDQDAGKTIANIAAPAGTVDGLRYKLADATKSYAYPDKDGDVNVDLAAIVSGTIEFVDADNNNALVQQQAFTDQTPGAQISPLTLPDGYVLAVDANGDVQSTYNYPTTDAQVVTVKVQKLTSGNRNDGMELTEVPSFSSDKNTIGASDTTTLTATKGGVLSYLNLKGQKADIYMSATDLKSNGSALPIKTLKANLSAGLADVYAANQTDGYGHMIVNDTTSKKGSLTIPDLQMTLSNNNFAAGTYSGTINYTMVSDDLN
ncbi:hypothetical protein FO433_07780 [Weissella cibaria]|uniref:hypothetical protein n=1 Tax=Weissella cibaria TaxID=137591 RepID=UPI001190F9CB|nr:hypothetical protein [Weissella cibaria]TVV25645.1 hypothetical protein FO433_07780 [Weissella cibaria]